MKTFLLIFIFALFLHASDVQLYGIYGGKCVKSFKSYDGNRIYLTMYNNGMLSLPYDPVTIKNLLDTMGKFELVKGGNDFCVSYNPTLTSNYYGMTKEQFTFLMSLTGSLCGFTFLFFACFLAIGFERRRK